MYPQIDKHFRCINIYSSKTIVGLWVHPFREIVKIIFKKKKKGKVLALTPCDDGVRDNTEPGGAPGVRQEITTPDNR